MEQTTEKHNKLDLSISNTESVARRASQHGQVEKLRKEFSIVSLIALQISLMATWEALSSVVATVLTSGGAPCLFYNYIISFIGTLCIGASLSELASIWPTAGGQYHWVAHLTPSRYRLPVSWVTGWISIGGQLVLAASAAFAAGLQFQALVILNNADSYVPARYQGMLFYWLVLLYSAAINLWGSKILPHSNNAAGILHIVGFVAIVIILGAMSSKHTADYVFEEVTNTSGWSSDGVSWLIGLSSLVYPFLGYDAACHLSEELPNPRRNVPIAMMGSILLNGFLGLIYAIILLFSLGDLANLLASETGFPFIQLFYNVTKSNGGATVMSLIVSFIAVAANSAGLTSTSRTAWAFARDQAIPFSGYFQRLTPRTQIPGRMIVCLTVLQMLLGFIYIGNTTAYNAILSMAIFGMYLSYLLPVVCMIIFGRRLIAKGVVTPGPFKLGGIGGPIINILALGWMLVVCIFCNFPTVMPVTAIDMNYCVVVMVGWLFVGLFYYGSRGRKQYLGPVMENIFVNGAD